MSGFTSPIGLSPTLLAPTAQATTADLARGKAKDAAEKFEAQFLSSMLQQMFEGIETDGPFGGGQGEQMFRSLMTEAMGKQMTKAGGIGLADTIQREILKMQGLT
jgi:Rod binding domain-containing protein